MDTWNLIFFYTIWSNVLCNGPYCSGCRIECQRRGFGGKRHSEEKKIYRRPEGFESWRGLKHFLGIATKSLLTKRYSLVRKNRKVCQEIFQSLECLILSLGLNRMHRTRSTCQRLQQMQLADSDTATHCNTLQYTATHCNTLQHPATYCNTCRSLFRTYVGFFLQHMQGSFYNMCRFLFRTAAGLFSKHMLSSRLFLQHV